MSEADVHFVITVDIKRVHFETKTIRTASNISAPVTERIVEDVTHTVVKSDKIDKAVGKAKAILELEVE